MPKAIFLLPDSRQVEIDVPVGTSLMRAAADHGIEAIVGDCGGNLSCSTCHVFVDTPFVDRVPSPSATEDQMLDYTAVERQPNSRLSCQLVMTEELDGLVVRVADRQV